ncbi:putative nucleoside diphosphate kinase-like domain-containing protein [Plasmopara halstedii]
MKKTPSTSRKDPSDADLNQLQITVLLLQADALEHDEAVRQELQRWGFQVQQQMLISLSPEAAQTFVLEVCNLNSIRYQNPLADKLICNETSSVVLTEVDDFAIQALSSGPTLVLGVAKSNAVADLIKLVGPADPAAWNESATPCLRAQFAKDAPRKLGLRCSENAATVQEELNFLSQHTSDFTTTRRKDLSLELEHVSKLNASVALKHLLHFVFPPHLQHATSAGRLFVFGLYGPLDANCKLRSGIKGLHEVTDREVKIMATRMEREDLLAVYQMGALIQEEEDQVVRQFDHMLTRFPQYTRRDIITLFAGLPRDTDGNLSFHEMQQIIFNERLRRVACMKEWVHPALAKCVRNPFARTLSVTQSDGLVNGAPASMFCKNVGNTNSANATYVARLLHSQVYQICHMEDGNSPHLTQNVRLIRSDNSQTCKIPWNSSCRFQRTELSTKTLQKQ